MNAKYSKTDFNFTTARSVLRIAYLLGEIIFSLGIVGGIIAVFSSNGLRGASIVFSSLLGALIVHLIYAFNIGFFELIKHAREIRDELVEMRTRGGTPDRTSSVQSNGTGINGGMRYDSTTHQYVKA